MKKLEKQFGILFFFLLSINWLSAQAYCPASNTDCNFEYITNVSISNLNNSSACDAPYDDFTAMIATIQTGQSYPATVTKSGTVATYVASIYIDWNQNGVFNLPGEEIQGNPNASTTGFDFTITAPAGALLGNTRMRVRMVQLSNTPSPCGASTRGDLEDYTINVTAPTPPVNDDCANAITITPSVACVNTNGSTVNGTQQFAPTNCSGNIAAAANEVWYQFTANGTSAYTIRTTGSGGFDPVLGLYSGCSAASLIICKDTSIINQTEIINAGVLAPGTYYYRIYGNGGNGSFTTCVVETSTSGPSYCTAINTDCDFEYITFVGLTTIGNTTDCGAQYDDFTYMVSYLQPGQTYTGHIKKSDILTNYFASVFIDWNQNGTFDLTETIVATATGTSTFDFTVIVPLGAVLGNTRMRVRLAQNAAPAACGPDVRGDIEDYTINLSANPPPAPSHDNCNNAIPITPTSVCGNLSGGSTVGSTQQYPALLCDGTTAAAANEVWFSFQANGSSGYQISINPDANFDPVIALYDACNAANMINCEDQAGVGAVENMFTGVLNAGTYYYRVYGKGNAGTFAHCMKELFPQDEYDCFTARVLCSKDPITETAVTGYGLDGGESIGSCLAAGVGTDLNTEENSKWYRWTASNNGNLTFDIIPNDVGFGPSDSLDVDFVLYELDPNLDCEGKTQLRCMGSGDVGCQGPTGLNATSIDVIEAPGCDAGQDNYLMQLTQTTGTQYALLVNNFQDAGRGYDIIFGGTATFLGAEPGFVVTTTPSCNYPKTVTVTDTSLNADTYAWDFGADATPPTATTAGPHTVNYSTFGTKTITLTLTATNGCDSTITKTVEIADTMTITTTVVASTCEQPNGSVTVTATGGNGVSTDKTYALDGGNPQASNQFNGLTPGTHTVTVTDLTGCTKDVNFTVGTTLVPDITDIIDVVACGNYTLPTITGNNLTGNESYYSGPGGTGTPFAAGTIISASTTMYMYDITNTTPACSDEEDFTITVNNEPTVSNIARSCNMSSTGYTVSFDVSGGNGGPYTVTEIAPGAAGGSFTGNTWTSNLILNGIPYQFNVDDGNSCGPVIVSGVRNCNCTTQTGTMGTATIRVCGNNSATATYNTSGEVNDGNDILSFVLHTNSGGNLGTILQTNSSPTFTFGAGMTYGTTYYISAINGDNDGSGNTDLNDPCLDVASGTPVVWNQTPTASFSGTASICAGQSAPLTYSFTGVGPFSLTYNNGTANTTLTNLSNGSTSMVSPSITRTYTLISVVSSTTTCVGTVDPGTVTITVNNAPTATVPVYTCNGTNTGYTATFDITGGNGGPYTFTEVSPGGIGGNFQPNGTTFVTNEIPSGTAFNFQFDDVNTCGPVVVQGVHNCACATNAGAMGSTKIDVCGTGNATAIHNTANLDLDADDVLEFVVHTNNSNVLGTILATNSTPTFAFGGAMNFGTVYYISAIAGNDDGTGSVDLNDPCLHVAVGTPVEWNEIPTTTASATSNSICEGDDIELFSTTWTNPANYSWSGPSSFTAFTQNTVRTAATQGMSGTYIVTIEANNCSSTSSVSITVNPVPNSTISNTPSGPFCENDPQVTLNAATGGGTWSGNGITDPNAGTFDPNVAGAGVHTISYTIGGTCPSTSTKDLTVNALPTGDFQADFVDGCDPMMVTFTLNSPNYDQVFWDFGDNSTSTLANPPAHMYPTGTYDVEMTLTLNGCSNTIAKPQYITVHPTPVTDFDVVPLGGSEFSFTNNSINGQSYLWDFGNGDSSTVENPSYNYSGGSGTYMVTLTTTSSFGCSSSYSTEVSIEEDVIFYVPNAFTPDGDNLNQYFMPVLTTGIDLTSYQLVIYNRWGQIVFETKDVNIGWDGTYDNALVPSGVYTWSLRFSNMETDEKYQYEGTLNLLR